MSDEIPDPAEEFEDVDLENIDYGFSDDDLDDVIDSVSGDNFLRAGKQCRLRKSEVEATDGESLTKSRQKFWIAGVQVDWPEHQRQRAQQLLDSDVWNTEDDWVEIRVGHERAVSREEAEDEVEWLAEQVVMLENDPNAPV